MSGRNHHCRNKTLVYHVFIHLQYIYYDGASNERIGDLRLDLWLRMSGCILVWCNTMNISLRKLHPWYPKRYGYGLAEKCSVVLVPNFGGCFLLTYLVFRAASLALGDLIAPASCKVSWQMALNRAVQNESNIHRANRLNILTRTIRGWFAPSQWVTVLLRNDASHWLGASIEPALLYMNDKMASAWGYSWRNDIKHIVAEIRMFVAG